MDLATCMKKMELVGVLAFATVDSNGAPQIRNISAIHYEPDAIYFFTARGKNFRMRVFLLNAMQLQRYAKLPICLPYAPWASVEKRWLPLLR